MVIFCSLDGFAGSINSGRFTGMVRKAGELQLGVRTWSKRNDVKDQKWFEEGKQGCGKVVFGLTLSQWRS